MIKTFSVGGMSCSACSQGIEKAIRKLSGINSVSVSLLEKEMRVDFDEGLISETVIKLTVENLGYKIITGEQKKDKYCEANGMKKRFITSLIILIPLMYLCMGKMLGFPVPQNSINFCLQFVLATAILVINKKFFISGIKAVKNGSPNMDTLVSLGSLSAYVYSIVTTVLSFNGSIVEHTFFDSSAMVLTLVTLGKWLEELSKIRTGDATSKLGNLIPKTAAILRDGKEITLPLEEVKVGDLVVLKAGEYVGVDGEIIEGSASVDKSAITGESIPEELSAGNTITSGSIVKDGYLIVKAQKVGEETLFSKIIQIVKDAGASKAPIQKVADKISGVFVPIVTVLAVITFIVWLIVTNDLYRAFNFGISVLVISCPCALGLATPVAVVAAAGKSATKGILFKNAEALQTACKINCVLLDKTATITVGKPKVTDYKNFTGESDSVIFPIASALERKSSHPLAECVINFCGDSEKLVENYEYVMGKGIIGEVDGVKYYLGNYELLPETAKIDGLSKEYEGKTLLYLADDYQLVSIFALADYLKPDSKDAIERLHALGIKTVMITGDNESVAKRIGDEVGIKEIEAKVLPQDKFDIVNKYKEMGNFVAMVGDGINDSPALKVADIGVAMGTGTDIAIDSAEVVIVNGNLSALGDMIEISKKSFRIIKENLFWAFFYNCIGIPFAAGVFSPLGLSLTPAIASALMCMSSLFVVTNALRIARKKKGKSSKTITKSVFVEKIMCMHCVGKVKDALLSIDGVESVSVDLKSKTATLKAQKSVTDDIILNKLSEINYFGQIK